MAGFPSGTVTFLFTDIEESTTLWERDSAAARPIVERYLAIVRQIVRAHDGVHFKTIGDGTQSAFFTAPSGVAAALQIQRALRDEPWPVADQAPRVRMALHAGSAEPRDGDYLAPCLNRLARLLDVAHGEQVLLSETIADLARDALPAGVTLESLGEIRLRDILQPEEVFQLHHPDLRAEFPPLKTPGRLPHNLPAHPTPFLGREREVEEVVALLQRPDVRLVTLTGAGGVGKTRLGMRVAAEVLESFPDGAFMVDLARQTDPNLVPSATASALGLREQSGQPIAETLTAHVSERRLLLLFDNFEHVLEAATFVAELLAAAPDLTVLVTSRARLGLQAEHEYRVETLPVPDPAVLPPLEEVARYDAISLFVSRARALRSDFALTAENAGTVAAICDRVDGLPLGIELAAARVKLLTPEALLARLEKRLPTLTGGARDLPARQRTLRDTIAWSHDLLSPDEGRLFRRLSVFAGGWTLEGAEAVNRLNGGGDVLTLLASLVDQSLVDRWPSDADEPRYGMLETIREFAGEQLAATSEGKAVEQAFESWLTSRAEAAKDGLKGSDQLLWLDRLESEHDNLRAALGRALERGDGSAALRLALALWEFWWTRGYRREGRAWLERTVSLAAASDIEGRADAEFALGRLAFDLGDYVAAEAHYHASLDARRALGDRLAEADVLSALAMIAVNRLAYDEASAQGEAALAITRERGDLRGVASALRVLGMIARERGDYERALALFEESMALGATLGDAAWSARIASQLGFTYRLAGNAKQAQHFLAMSRKLHTELGDRYALAVISTDQGHLAFDAGDIDRAIELYEEALRHFDAVEGLEGVVEALEFLAVTAVAKKAFMPALRIFGAAEAARAALLLPPRLESDEERVTASREAAIQASGRFATSIMADGKVLSLGRARDEALKLAESLGDRPKAIL